jgi:hypothetical protein
VGDKPNMKLQAALKYLNDFHLPVIPWQHFKSKDSDKPNKRPLVPWKKYQTELPTPEDINQWWEKWPDANVGIVTGPLSKVVAFDTDSEEADQYFNEIMPDNLSCPVCQTPRGGKHYWFKSDVSLRNATAINGHNLDFRGEGGFICCPPSTREDGKAYQFVRGLSIRDIAIPEIPQALVSLLLNNKSSYIRGDDSQIQELFMEGRRNSDLFHIAHCLTKGNATKAESAQVLRIIAKNCNPPYPESEIEAIIQSALDRKVRGEAGLTDDILRIIAVSDGIFCVSNVVKAYQENQNASIVANSIRTQIRTILLRFKEKGIIKRAGNQDGFYIRIDEKCEDMDIENVTIENHPLRLPLDLRNYVKIMPKNIIVVAGSKSSGKTAFLLNTAWLNRNHKEGVYYYNSEMAVEELKIRLDCFGSEYPITEWKKIKFKERTSNFADIIKKNPNAIHIVDFLEKYADFFEIGQDIRYIYDAIHKGVAIVAIQKNAGASLGLGGGRSIEKARLYLSLDYGKMTITDAKLFEIRHINPRGWVLDYKLHDGCHYQPDPRGWYEPSEIIEGLNPKKNYGK